MSLPDSGADQDNDVDLTDIQLKILTGHKQYSAKYAKNAMIF